MQQTIECDIAIIGGGLGGIAAALAAADAGLSVVMTEPTSWIGGQATAQAASVLDEHRYIETFGGTRSYNQFREGVRSYYRVRYDAPERMPDGMPLNPGNNWAGRLSFEPRAGLRVLNDMLSPYVDGGQLTILLDYTPISAEVRGSRITQVSLNGPGNRTVDLRALYYLDATDMGDLLPLVHAPYVTGAEPVEQTGEPHASRQGPLPGCVQSFTCCFLMEYRPNEDHTIQKPYGYEAWRDSQPFTLSMRRKGGKERRTYMFSDDLSFWRFRRLFDAAQLAGGRPDNERNDIVLVNWDAIDYYKESLIDRTPAQRARIVREAKRLSLSFLYWLQTEAPRDEGRGRGYPGLRLLPEALGTQDGLAKAPLIRESRRILGMRRIVEQDLITQDDRSSRAAQFVRAAHYADTAGVGWYPLDMHRRAGDPSSGCAQRVDFDETLPFQIPLGALISPSMENLIAASKNIATTHITAAAYRAHPIEWNVGEAAGSLAVYCLRNHVSLQAAWEQTPHLRALQRSLLERGIPLVWTNDLGLSDRSFAAIQSCLIAAPPPNGTPRFERLQVLPDEPVSLAEAAWLLRQVPAAPANAHMSALLERWRDSHRSPFTAEDLNAAALALDLPLQTGGTYPTLRQICEKLTNFV